MDITWKTSVLSTALKELTLSRRVNDPLEAKALLSAHDQLPDGMRIAFNVLALRRYSDSFVQSPRTDELRSIKRQLVSKLHASTTRGVVAFDTDAALAQIVAECGNEPFELAPVLGEMLRAFLVRTALQGVPDALLIKTTNLMNETVARYSSWSGRMRLAAMVLANRFPRMHAEVLDDLEQFLAEDPIPNDLLAWLFHAAKSAGLDPRGFILEIVTALAFNPIPTSYAALYYLGGDAGLARRITSSLDEDGVDALHTSTAFDRFFAEVTRLHLNLVKTGRMVEGRAVEINIQRANRNPEHWCGGEDFNADRSSACSSLTFGAGPRSCPGREVTKLAVWSVVRAMLSAPQGEFVILNPEAFRCETLLVMKPAWNGRDALRARYVPRVGPSVSPT